MKHIQYEAVDLFCGVGGLSYGLKKSGINVIAGLDFDKTCEYAYTKNIDAKFIEADISNYNFKDLKKLYSQNSIKILVGCAPCQPFSAHSNKLKKTSNDSRWNLVNYFLEAIREVKPEFISMENVRGFVKTNIFKNFINQLSELQYHIDYDIVHCPDYGIPQNRNRLVLIGSNMGKLSLPSKTHDKKSYLTVKDAIFDLPALEAGASNKGDLLHRAKGLNSLNIARIKQSKPNGTWKDWNKNLLPECYKKPSGQTYTSVYGRMSWDKPSPTITTQFFNYGSGRFGHPTQNRGLSLREGAILQTFPSFYDFGVDNGLQTLGRHIGNAVPPRLGEIIGKTILTSAKKYNVK